MKQRIAIISDTPGWHGEQLRLALQQQGCDASFVALQQCSIDLSHKHKPVVLPGFAAELPTGVFVRGIPGGTLEEIVFWLDILHALRELGVPVYNDVRGIERSVDKAMTSFLLQRQGIATPPCWVFSDLSRARSLVKKEQARGHELVFKPLFGSQGEGLQRISDPGQLPDSAAAKGIYYLQRFIETPGDHCFDWRVFVIGGRAMATMRREATGWITNVANGADCLPAVLSEPLAGLAIQAVDKLGLCYAGVDMICDTEGNHHVIEVNSIPAWRGLQTVCSHNLAALLVEDFLEYCRSGERMQVVG